MTNRLTVAIACMVAIFMLIMSAMYKGRYDSILRKSTEGVTRFNDIFPKSIVLRPERGLQLLDVAGEPVSEWRIPIGTGAPPPVGKSRSWRMEEVGYVTVSGGDFILKQSPSAWIAEVLAAQIMANSMFTGQFYIRSGRDSLDANTGFPKHQGGAAMAIGNGICLSIFVDPHSSASGYFSVRCAVFLYADGIDVREFQN